MSKTLTIPIFPLNTVLLPEGPLPLRIFEPRYLDMVSECLRDNIGFGVSLIKAGKEAGEVATTHKTGTLAEIHNWHKRHDGLLGITAVGIQRYSIISTTTRKNNLLEATVELIPNDNEMSLPEDYLLMADFLRQLIKQIPHLYESVQIRYDDASWVSNRLTELLPISMIKKQELLKLQGPLLRLERLRQIVDQMNIHL